jgi:hypothetical protein
MAAFLPEWFTRYFQKEIQFVKSSDGSTSVSYHWKSVTKYNREISIKTCRCCAQEKYCINVELVTPYPTCQDCINVFFDNSKTTQEDQLNYEKEKMANSRKEYLQMKQARKLKKAEQDKLKATFKEHKQKVKELEDAKAAVEISEVADPLPAAAEVKLDL